MCIKNNIDDCLKAIEKGTRSFDLVYYLINIILHHHSRREIKENATDIRTCLNWLESITDDPTTESTRFYHEQICCLQSKFNELISVQ
jgi:hypothetical protein